LCQRVHGRHRGGELNDAIKVETARVERVGEITAYATGVGHFAHAIAENNQGLKALIGAAKGFPGGGFLVPTPQRRAVLLVPAKRPSPRAPNDLDDNRSLQRAQWRLTAEFISSVTQ
jgi:hypothetical protein